MVGRGWAKWGTSRGSPAGAGAAQLLVDPGQELVDASVHAGEVGPRTASAPRHYAWKSAPMSVWTTVE